MQAVNIPSKYLVPFATNDSAKVEIPVTTATVGRASQSLGFPPITGQPPETGGLPPQLEDFNGAVNQIARVAWWAQLGGQWRYDATFASDANINGYPAGAELQSVTDNRITWLSLVDNNTADPDGAGTGWVPLVSYAPATITTAGGTTTPTPPIAAHETLIVSGTLSSNAVLILPVWTRGWTITNSTTGAFTVTVKTAAGSGVVIPQNGAPTRVTGDGTNILQQPANIAPATGGPQALQLAQATGRLLRTIVYTGNGTYTPDPLATAVEVEGVGGGGAGGGVVNPGAGTATSGGGGSSGAFGWKRVVGGLVTTTVTIGAGGAGVVGAAGGNGTATSFGALLVIPGGGGAPVATAIAGAGFTGSIGTQAVAPTGADVGFPGNAGSPGFLLTAASLSTGAGANSIFGAGGSPVGANGASSANGVNASGFGSGGAGAFAIGASSSLRGGNGNPGLLIVREYS